MALSNMQVFNEFVMPAVAEMYPQMIQQFNAASNNTLMLTGANFTGSFYEQSFYNELFDAQRRVDRFSANATQAPTDISQFQHDSVKVAGGFGPIRYEPGQMTWLQKPTQEGITIAAEQFAQALLADQLNTAIAALVAAIGNNLPVVNDVTGAQIDQLAINGGLAKFGDSSQGLQALVMTGIQYHTLVGTC